jgi:hypothetical protein
MKIAGLILAALLIIGSATAGQADLNTELNSQASQMNSLAASQGTSKVVDKIGGEFSDFLGTDSKAVVTGLRNGTPITLARTVSTPTSTTSTPPPNTTPTTTTTTINPPTGKMGFGNVFISLALAKQELGQMGITQPTPEQLKAALVGGSFTTGTGTTTATGTTSGTGTTTNNTKLEGILTMRSQNMGWGQITQKLGFKLGPVVSGLKSTNHGMISNAAMSTSNKGVTAAGNQSTTASKTGIVSGSGKVHGDSGREISGKNTSGEGIVSSSGRSIGSGNVSGYGKGVVTGTSHVAGGTNNVTTGGGPGNSSGHGNGHNK